MNTRISIYDMPPEVVYRIIHHLSDVDTASFLYSCKYMRSCVRGSLFDIHCSKVGKSRISHDDRIVLLRVCNVHTRPRIHEDFLCMSRTIQMTVDNMLRMNTHHGSRIKNIRGLIADFLLYITSYTHRHIDIVSHGRLILSGIDYIANVIWCQYYESGLRSLHLKRNLDACIHGSIVKGLLDRHISRLAAATEKVYILAVQHTCLISYICIHRNARFDVNMDMEGLDEYISSSPYVRSHDIDVAYIFDNVTRVHDALASYVKKGNANKNADPYILYITNYQMFVASLLRVCVDSMQDPIDDEGVFDQLINVMSVLYRREVNDENFYTSIPYIMPESMSHMSIVYKRSKDNVERNAWSLTLYHACLINTAFMNPEVCNIDIVDHDLLQYLTNNFIKCNSLTNSYSSTHNMNTSDNIYTGTNTSGDTWDDIYYNVTDLQQ